MSVFVVNIVKQNINFICSTTTNEDLNKAHNSSTDFNKNGNIKTDYAVHINPNVFPCNN